MKKNITLFFLLLVVSLNAQQEPCGTGWLQRRAIQDTVLLGKYRRSEAAALQHFSSPKTSVASARQAPDAIPVVFHIVHQNGVERLSEAQVRQALVWLNEAYSNSGSFDRGSGTDVPIRFCLARRTPNGTATTGITYTENALTDLTIETEDDDIKRLTGWNARDYLNIWIVREICSFNNNCAIAAYAYHPLFHGSGVDGVVIEARWLTEAATISPLAHEVGHYFGLYHTFEGGCLNDDCLRQGDYVCDTPPDRSTAGIPCDQNANTCDTDVNSGFAWDHPDPTRNHMDYGPFACMHDFTVGQADRMVFFLKNDRRSLLLSKGCQQPCPTAPVVAAFAPVDTVVAVGTTLTFFNKSQNAAQYAWTLNGTVPLGNQLNANFTDKTKVPETTCKINIHSCNIFAGS